MRKQPSGPTDPATPAARPPMDAALFVQSFFDRAAVGVGLTTQGRIVYSNPALQSLLGYPAAELAGMDFTQYTHPEDIPASHAPDADHSPNSHDYWRQEKRYVTKDGRVIWGRVILYGLPESVLQERFSLLMVEDITEQKSAEEALGEREQFLRALFELTDHGILLTRVDGTVLDANPAACALLGMTVEEMCARGRAGLVVPGDDIERSLRKRAEQGRVETEVGLRHKDGTTIRAELTSVVLPDASPNPRTFIMFKDISQRKRMEEALRQSEGRYQTLVNLSPDAIVVQTDGKYVFANPAAARLFGASSPQEIVGRDMFGLLHPDYHELIKHRAPQVLAGAVTVPMEIKVLRLDGSHVTVEASAAKIEFDGRTATQVVFHDLTERKEAEKLLRLTQFSVDCFGRTPTAA
jgi:PAS domain S-box-containing protein